jgi:hypothetical protein
VLPFLSHVAAEKSSRYFAMFSYGPPMVPNGPHSTELRCEFGFAVVGWSLLDEVVAHEIMLQRQLLGQDERFTSF